MSSAISSSVISFGVGYRAERGWSAEGGVGAMEAVPTVVVADPRTPVPRRLRTSHALVAVAALTLTPTGCGTESGTVPRSGVTYTAGAPTSTAGAPTSDDPGSAVTPSTPTPEPEPERETETDGSITGSGGTDRARTLRSGASGPEVTRVEERLRNLGYWLGTPDGAYDRLTVQAVDAFQKLEGLAVDGIVGPNTAAALADASRPAPRSGLDEGIEVHEQPGVVFVVHGGQVRHVLHSSAGTYERYLLEGRERLADTPNGRHEVFWRVDGRRTNELGTLWRPAYVHEDGIALHGSGSVPPTPSSHGCVRLTRAAMDMLWASGAVAEGTTVVVTGPAP